MRSRLSLSARLVLTYVMVVTNIAPTGIAVLAHGDVRSGLGPKGAMVHSKVCKAATKDINGRLTIGFQFRIWGDACWHLYRRFRQPVTLNRAIHDLTSNYFNFGTGIRLETCRCTRRGNDLVHR